MTTSGPRLDPAVQRVVTTRVIRGFSDGVVSIVLASYLTSLGLRRSQHRGRWRHTK